MITIGLEQIKDCDHCSKIYGTLGCCTTVNNKWVYSCMEGQKEYIIDRVLEIIEVKSKHPLFSHYDTGYLKACEEFRQEVEKLKEGKE